MILIGSKHRCRAESKFSLRACVETAKSRRSVFPDPDFFFILIGVVGGDRSASEIKFFRALSVFGVKRIRCFQRASTSYQVLVPGTGREKDRDE